MIINPIILLEIILSAITLIMAIFLAILGTVAFLGWRNLKDIEEKQKIFLTQRQEILDEAKISIKKSKEDAKEIIKILKRERKKVKLPAELEKQSKKTEELIEKLNNTIDNAEKRVGNLRMTGITSTSSVITSTPIGRYISGGDISLTGYEKRCIYCGKIYYDDRLSTASSKCPYCKNFNL